MKPRSDNTKTEELVGKAVIAAIFGLILFMILFVAWVVTRNYFVLTGVIIIGLLVGLIRYLFLYIGYKHYKEIKKKK